MRITENTPTRFTITCRRPILVDLILLVFIPAGLAFAYGIATAERTPLTAIFVILGLGFAAVGVWGLMYNARSTVTLDTSLRTVQFHWRKLFSVEQSEWPISDLRKVWVHEDDQMHTLSFTFTGAEPILLEKAYGANPKAYEVAKTLQDWLETTGCAPDAT